MQAGNVKKAEKSPKKTRNKQRQRHLRGEIPHADRIHAVIGLPVLPPAPPSPPNDSPG
jgi:hypothetical protein